MVKSIWKGSINFGLVNIPIKVYTATEGKFISFRLLCGRCKTPLRYKRWCAKCKAEISWDNVLHGFEYAKGKYVIFKREELEELPLPRAKNIEIVEFINPQDLDPLFYDKSYFVVPQAGAEHPYELFREALHITNRAAIGKVAMRQKEYLVVLRGYRNAIIMSTLFYADEVRSPEQFAELAYEVKIPREQLKLAKTLITKLAKPFNISEFKNVYKEAITSLIEAKLAGKKIAAIPARKPAKDLIAALKASIKSVPSKRAAKARR